MKDFTRNLSDDTKAALIGMGVAGFLSIAIIPLQNYRTMMRTKTQILQEQLKGAEVAIKLKVGMKVEYLCAPGASVQTIIISEPWKLGHGTWVCKIDGASGGVDCAKITILKD